MPRPWIHSSSTSMPVDELAQLIRPAGYYNVKAVRLRNLIAHMVEKHQRRPEFVVFGSLWSLFGRSYCQSKASAKKRLIALYFTRRESPFSWWMHTRNESWSATDSSPKRLITIQFSVYSIPTCPWTWLYSMISTRNSWLSAIIIVRNDRYVKSVLCNNSYADAGS